MELLSHPQSTGWSALQFSADRGDSATTEALLKAGANLHLNDKVWESTSPPRAHLVHFSFTAWLRCFFRHVYTGLLMRTHRVLPHEEDSHVMEKLLATFTTHRIVMATHVYMHNKMRLDKEEGKHI